MTFNKAGEETRKKIYWAAKKLFYVNGFQHTSCMQIAESAEANVALISYYYKNKLNLGLEICNEFTNDIRIAVIEKMIEAGYEYEPIIGLGVEYRAFKKFQIENPSYNRFIKDLCNENALLLSDHYVGVNLKFLEEKYDIRLSETDEKIAHYCITSIYNGIINVMDKGYIDETEFPAERLVDIILKILDFEKAERDNILEQSKEIFDKIDISMSRYFRVK